MSVELIFFFLLGFICSGFLGLMMCAFVWQRAVRLTRRRFQATTPMTLQEIRADKDQMRAEFAMTTRKLERTVSQLQSRATGQLKEIAQNRADLKELTRSQLEAEERINELRTAHKLASIELAEKEHEIDGLSKEITSRERQLDKREADLEALEGRLADMESEMSGQRVTSVAQDTRLQSVEEERNDLREERKNQAAAIKALNGKLKENERAIESEQRRAEDAEKRLERLKRDLKESEEALERRLREVKRFKQNQKQVVEETETLQARIGELEAIEVDKNTEIARIAIELEEARARAEGHSVEAAMTVLEAEKEILQEKLEKAAADLAKMQAENEQLRTGTDADWSDERRDNALLRERLNDVAAQVTRMAAALEGNDSVIEQILSDMAASAHGEAQAPHSLSAKMRALAQFADQRAAE